MEKKRLEKDSLGEIEVPIDAYYGAQTQRAVENFPISGQKFNREFIEAIGLIKLCAAEINSEFSDKEKEIWKPIISASEEVYRGKWDEEFVVDIYQTGSGTSTNMNANEIIAKRAIEINSDSNDNNTKIHPNDHVNKGQSSNDVFPAAIHISTSIQINNKLIPALKKLAEEFENKTKNFKDIIKIGRTHLQDATPITLGQEFSGYAAQLNKSLKRIESCMPELYKLPLGGTAVGTGLNTNKIKTKKIINKISKYTQLPFVETDNHFESQSSKDALVQASASLKTLSVSLMKISNDIRWLGSGPRCGVGEIKLPPTQPGSSIMPGKVNPVQAEAVGMVCARVIGNDTAITIAGQSGNFELNVMMPLIASSILESIKLLSNSMSAFLEKCIKGIQADKKRCNELTELSLALVTSLVPVIGYDKSAEIAKKALEESKTIREIILENNIIEADKLDSLLDPQQMI